MVNQLSLCNSSEEKVEGIVVVQELELMEPEASLLKVCDLDGMAHCDALNEQIGYHEGMVAVDGLPSGDDVSSTKETLAGQETKISAEQHLSVDSDVKGDAVDAEEWAPATVGMQTKASAEQRLSWDSSEADGAHAEERALPGTVSVKSEVSAEQRLPLVCSVDAGGYAEQRTLPGTVSEELKASAEQRLSSSSENGISVVSAEKRVPMEVGDGEQQAFEEVQIAPSANSLVSMDRVYAEERAHVDPESIVTCTWVRDARRAAGTPTGSILRAAGKCKRR